MLIETGNLTPRSLAGQVAIVTGGGGGIGFEAARALVWLGASVVIAEVREDAGRSAAGAIGRELGEGRVVFVRTDVGDEASVAALAAEAEARFGRVDIVLNNATVATLGAVKDVAIAAWDASYRVNLRGPVLLARAFIPGMLSRDAGVFACVSSTGTAHLGAYETFKAAQVHLANTLDAELEGTGVCAYTIGPGLVPTETAVAAIDQLAPLLGMSKEAFFAVNQQIVLSVEQAGAGFAASVALADQFRGQEISSLQALMAAGIHQNVVRAGTTSAGLSNRDQALNLCRRVRTVLAEQVAGWKQRSLFERQWVIRDFKKTAGRPAEQWLEALTRLEAELAEPAGSIAHLDPPLARLAGYYGHLGDLASGYEKDPVKLEEALGQVHRWQAEAQQLHAILNP
jgi:NAD(P)-dependent dehydrogenase (short-subunit alcohol dehydrogenase family)